MNEQRDITPYAPPKARLEREELPGPETPPGEWSAMPRKVSAVNGLMWLWQAGRVVAARPGLWAAALCLTAAVPTVLGLIIVDFDGDDDEEAIFFMLLYLFWFFWPVLTGGIVNAAHKQLQGERIRLRDIFAFFRSGLLFLGWSCVGIFVTPPMVFVLALLLGALGALAALHFPSAVAFPLACALPGIFITGNIFIAAAAALHGDWPLRVIFRAGLVNMPAFLLNLPVATLAICAVLRVAGFIESLLTGLPGLKTLLSMTLVFALIFGVLSLAACAAVRDIFYNEG